MKSLIMVLVITVLCVLNSYSQVVVSPSPLPHGFSLSQNVPDPFDTSGTDIQFTLAKMDSVSLWVTDTIGNLVVSLVSGAHTAGQYQVYWNAKSQDSTYIIPGIYLCKIKVYSNNTIDFKDSIRMHFQLVTGVRENTLGVQPSYSRLSQNYPNPFNPTTTISFNLQSRSYVSLKIFDLLGREVATIVSEEMSAGSHTRQWNAVNMSSGIYFYRLQAGLFTETKKLVLLR